MQTDVLILGQGLAGSTLAWRLAERGVSAIVVDRGGVDPAGRPSASRVAAGLITPVTGKRMTVAEDYAGQWESARAFYRRVEAETGCSLLSERPALRVCRDASEHRRFLERASHGQGVLATLDEIVASGFSLTHAPCGAFVMPNAARLDVPAYLRSTRAWLGERLVRASCDVREDLRVDRDGVAIAGLGLSARCAVLCVGHSAPPCRWLDGVRFSPAKGEVLTIRSPTLRAERVIHAGVWIAPEGGDVYRVGATTEWFRLDATPTAMGRDELLARLAAAGVADAEVVDHQAAVRPATPDRRPTFGFCEAEPRVGWLNGLGAKGSLWAPWAAERMAELVANR